MSEVKVVPDGNFVGGWIREEVSEKDYTTDHPAVRPILDKTTFKSRASPGVDLRSKMPPIYDQGQLGSCVPNGCNALLAFLVYAVVGKFIDFSRLWTYFVGRNMMGTQYVSQDSGLEIRNGMGALAEAGAPTEKAWPYTISQFTKEPGFLAKATARSWIPLTYWRLDPAGAKPADVLAAIKATLSSGLPVVFGFNCYESLQSANTTKTGIIPFPKPAEKLIGGHCIVAVGYDDTTQMLLIRNSWGTSWGIKGYGWMPYDYVLKKASQDTDPSVQTEASDFWTAGKAAAVEPNQFL